MIPWHHHCATPEFGAGNCTRSNVFRLTRTALYFSAIPALGADGSTRSFVFVLTMDAPNFSGTSALKIVGGDDGTRTHTAMPLKHSSPADWTTSPHYIPMEGVEPTTKEF